MGSHKWKANSSTYNATEAIELLDLPVGRNGLYKKLTELGILYENHIPNDEMIRNNLMTYVEKSVWKGGRRLDSHFIPLFTDSGLGYLENLFSKNNAQNDTL